MNNGKERIVQRRKFLQASLSAVAFSGILPTLPSFISCKTVTPAIIDNNEDDLQKLKASIGDKNKPLKWLFTGDSITQGAKHTAGYRSYPEIFAERVRFEMNRSRDIVINSSISGHTSRDILDDFQWRAAQFTPAVVSMMIGTNDAADSRNVSAEEFEKRLMKLVDLVRNIPAIPVLHTPNIIKATEPDDRKKLPSFVAIIRKLAKEKQVILVDHWSYWESNRDKVASEGWLNDRLHPNGKGHLEMARLLFKTLSICSEPSFTCTADMNFH